MSKFAIGENVQKAADDHEECIVIAPVPTVGGNFRYAVDMEGYFHCGRYALQLIS
jgi:hypothetical protein